MIATETLEQRDAEPRVSPASDVYQSLPTVVLLSQAPGGGVMRHVIDLYHGLQAVGIPARLILSNRDIVERYKRELQAIRPADIAYISLRRSPHPSDLLAVRQINRILGNIGGPVVLHAHSTKAGLLGPLVRSNVVARVLTPHAYRGSDPGLTRPVRWAISGIERMYSRAYDRIVAEVPQELEYARSLGLAPEKLRLIPNGIPTRNIDFAALAKAREERPSRTVLGFVGRLVYQKNPLLFLEVMRELAERGCHATAILLGDGPLRAEMDAMAARYGLTAQLDWRGEVAAGELYPKMDVMVHTSLYEALPYALIEAAAALLPVVATRNPGSEAVLGQDLADNLRPQQDARGLAEAVLRLLQEREQYTAQMEALHRIAVRYSTETMIELYKTLFVDLAEASSRRPRPASPLDKG